MLEPDFNPAATCRSNRAMRLSLPCRAPRCARNRATVVLRKLDAAGRPVRQIELCDRHAATVIARGSVSAEWRYSTAATGANQVA